MKVLRKDRLIDFSCWGISRSSNSWEGNKRWNLTISKFLIINMKTTVTWFLKRAIQGLIQYSSNRFSTSRWLQPGFNFRSHPMTSGTKKMERWIPLPSTRRISWWWTLTSLRTQLSNISYLYTEITHLTTNMNSTTGRHLSNTKAIMSTR